MKTVYEESRITGNYVRVVEGEADLEEKEFLRSVYMEELEKQVDTWLKIAEEKSSGTRIKIIWSVDNDDPYELDKIFEARGIRNRGILELESSTMSLEIVSVGEVNPTPMRTFREAPDSSIYIRGKSLLSKVDPKRTIMNFHAPPYSTKLDMANLPEGRRHVGSRTVLDLLGEFKPLLGLFGHIHESPGVDKVQGVTSINPGSESIDGVLRLALIVIERIYRGIASEYRVKTATIVVG